MLIGLEGPNHLHNKGMIEQSHNLVFVPHHINPIFLLDEFFIDNLQRTEAPIGQPPRQIHLRESAMANTPVNLEIREPARNRGPPHGLEF